MELTHTFTVPIPPAEAWATFEDVASVAACFPGAAVTSAEGDTFEGTVKVKLGPIAMQYAGSGSFVEKDQAAGRMVLSAKGRDKRGNGTAGATVTATLAPEGAASTTVVVVSDLHITGKPAQFGRGVIQDVSDKLLGQFVACLEEKVGRPLEPVPQPMPEPGGTTTPVAAAVEDPAPTADGPAPTAAPAAGEDALDLGSAVLPALARQYGPAAAGVLLLLLLVRRLVRRR